MSVNTKDVVDGVQSITRGVNSGVPPNTLMRDQLAWLINGTTRGGFPMNRPAWKKLGLRFVDSTNTLDTTLRDNFEDGLFQGATPFTRQNQLVASIGGRLFTLNLSDSIVTDVSISGDLDRADLRRVWFIEAEDFLIRQDNQAAPIIFDGASTRRSNSFGEEGLKEVPTGNVMAYVNGRLWVALPDRQSFVAGDIVYGPSGTPVYGRRDAILKFTENEFLNGGGAFPVPAHAGQITAMAPVAQLDTSTGQGPLQVFTQSSVFSVNTPTTRTEWQNVTYPIQSLSVIAAGATSDRATTNVNGDIWFRSLDGVRSFMVARRDFGTWANTALSKEMDRTIRRDDLDLLSYSSAVLFDNRLLMTAVPHLEWDHGTVHRGVMVLDFNPASALTERASPVWDGIWTGLNILQLVRGVFNGVERCFAFTLGDDNDIEVWELTRDAANDFDGSVNVPIQWSVELPSLNYADKGWSLKQLEYADFSYDSLAGTVEFDLDYRPDQDPRWQNWHTWSNCATLENCLTLDPATGCSTSPPANLHTQYRKRVRVPRPANDCDSITGSPYRQGYEFQPRLTITGPCRLKRARFWASGVTEPTVGACPSSDTCTTLEVCNDDFSYSIE